MALPVDHGCGAQDTEDDKEGNGNILLPEKLAVEPTSRGGDGERDTRSQPPLIYKVNTLPDHRAGDLL
jgi:hypothetical protein